MDFVLDAHPMSEKVLYINELYLTDKLGHDRYANLKEYELAKTGKTKSQGGILPDDNVRVYVPMDISHDSIMSQLRYAYYELGSVSEKNEFAYSSAVQAVFDNLEIYDRVHIVRNIKDAVRFKRESGQPDVLHSTEGLALAKEIGNYLIKNEGCAECFPYDEIEFLVKEYGLEELTEAK